MSPDRLWDAWIGQSYPGVTPGVMCQLSLRQMVAMHAERRAM